MASAKTLDGLIIRKYLWQGLTRLLAVYDGSDNLVMRFEYADGRMPVAMATGGTTYYLTYDQVGSLRVVADSSGDVVKRIDYDSFGNSINDSNPTFDVLFGFAGDFHDRDTGLVRFGFRDYDPDVGRWTAKDPIFFEGGDTNLYGYCLNDPINWVDAWGLIRIVTFIKRNGNVTYGAEVTVLNTETKTVEFIGQGSTLPNRPSTQNTVAEGIYSATRTKMATKGKPGIYLGNTLTTPYSPRKVAKEVFVHCGSTPDWRGSRACLTIKPSDCEKFFELFGVDESVLVAVWR